MKTRPAIDYSAPRAARVGATGIDVRQPASGYYRFRLRGGAVRGAVRIWHGPPLDPVTGEELDRFWRWQAEFDGEAIDIDRVWPACAGEPISEREYREYVARRIWAETHAPESAFAQRGKRLDPLSSQNPLPF